MEEQSEEMMTTFFGRQTHEFLSQINPTTIFMGIPLGLGVLATGRFIAKKLRQPNTTQIINHQPDPNH